MTSDKISVKIVLSARKYDRPILIMNKIFTLQRTCLIRENAIKAKDIVNYAGFRTVNKLPKKAAPDAGMA